MKTALVNSESDMFSFFEMTPDLVCIVGKDGFLKEINHAVIEKLGYSKEELLANPVSSFIFPGDREMTLNKRAGLLNGKALFNFENRYVTKSGNIVWLHWTSLYLPDKEIVFAIAKDITQRKLAEKEVDEKYKKFKKLANHFKSRIEKDRKYFSVELHEELAQLVSVIKLDLNSISNHIPNLSGFLKSRIDHASGISELLVQTIRKISFEMSPYMLYNLGLDKALEWLGNDFTILNHIPCFFESNYNEADLTQEIKIDFFRICQESLSNVMNHAEANSVKISIENRGDSVQLTVTDDGKGFDVKKQLHASGLANMRERVASINGNLVIESTIGRGTKVIVTIHKQTTE
ncbi:MAG: PAS domain S-box protein [Ginsengibacter sp.]